MILKVWQTFVASICENSRIRYPCNISSIYTISCFWKVNENIVLSRKHSSKMIERQWIYHSILYFANMKIKIWKESCFEKNTSKFKKQGQWYYPFKIYQGMLRWLDINFMFSLYCCIKCESLKENTINANCAKIRIWTYCWPFNK